MFDSVPDSKAVLCLPSSLDYTLDETMMTTHLMKPCPQVVDGNNFVKYFYEQGNQSFSHSL